MRSDLQKDDIWSRLRTTGGLYRRFHGNIEVHKTRASVPRAFALQMLGAKLDRDISNHTEMEYGVKLLGTK